MQGDAEAWPTSDLEHLGACPACGSLERSRLFHGLRDETFRTAPGEWTLWRCPRCAVAYLDPRPTEASIARAYASYYTHSEDDPGKDGLIQRRDGLIGRVKQGIRNDYLNHKFKHNLPHAIIFGHLLFRAVPRKAMEIDDYVRQLKAPARSGAKLLDIGCGNGRFLKVAQALGYQAEGLEPDTTAAEIARSAGFQIYEQTLTNRRLSRTDYDVITMNHVIEHLHNPISALELIFNALNPGGRLWISTPNILSTGFSIYGKFWRGLEIPRHLIIFTPDSLEQLLNRVGFGNVSFIRPNLGASNMLQQSAALLLGRDCQPPWPDLSPTMKRLARDIDKAAIENPIVGETINISARKPGHHSDDSKE